MHQRKSESSLRASRADRASNLPILSGTIWEIRLGCEKLTVEKFLQKHIAAHRHDLTSSRSQVPDSRYISTLSLQADKLSSPCSNLNMPEAYVSIPSAREDLLLERFPYRRYTPATLLLGLHRSCPGTFVMSRRCHGNHPLFLLQIFVEMKFTEGYRGLLKFLPPLHNGSFSIVQPRIVQRGYSPVPATRMPLPRAARIVFW